MSFSRNNSMNNKWQQPIEPNVPPDTEQQGEGPQNPSRMFQPVAQTSAMDPNQFMVHARNVHRGKVRTQQAGALASATQGGALCPVPTSWAPLIWKWTFNLTEGDNSNRFCT